jgi:hypothetical protein
MTVAFLVWVLVFQLSGKGGWGASLLVYSPDARWWLS